MKKRNQSGKFRRKARAGIDRINLVKQASGVWARRYHDTSVICGEALGDWFVLPKDLTRLTLCVSKRRMPESYRVELWGHYLSRSKRTYPIHRGLRKILSRMGGGVLYIAVEI